VSVPFPEPTAPAGSRAEVLGRYLDYFRDRVAAKLRELPEGELRRSRLPSGWAPLELLKHLTAMERRWLEWGFAGRAVAECRSTPATSASWTSPASWPAAPPASRRAGQLGVPGS
jgi:uncharacterized damage-inducible protein DinB